MEMTKRNVPESLLKRVTVLIVPLELMPKRISALNALLFVLPTPDPQTMSALCAPQGLTSLTVNASQPIVMVCVKGEMGWLQITKRRHATVSCLSKNLIIY